MNVASTAGAVKGSEMRQSLWINPFPKASSNPDNSVWGYYADGFFDRREIVDANGLYAFAKSTVVFTTNDVAYICSLFFNKFSNASLAFPASGYRLSGNGTLYDAGYRGYSWSSSAYSSISGWYLYIRSGTAYQTKSTRSFGFALRPIVAQ